jgi:hypothetical protein
MMQRSVKHDSRKLRVLRDIIKGRREQEPPPQEIWPTIAPVAVDDLSTLVPPTV